MSGHTQPTVVVLDDICPWKISLCKNLKHYRDTDEQRILRFPCTQAHFDLQLEIVCIKLLKKYFYFRCQKLIFDSELLSIWQRPQNTEVDCVRLGMHGHTQPKVLVSYACNIYLTNISMKKIKDIHAFLPEIFLIRKSCKAEFVKQNFSQIWDLHRGTENFKIF